MPSVDYFLMIDTIPGESVSAKHKNEIEVLSWAWGEMNSGAPASGGGGGAGKAQMQPFHFVARSSIASPKLFLACATGQHIKQAVLTAVRQAGGKPVDYLVWTMSEVLVSSYQMSAENQDALPVDQFDLEFARIEIEYHQVKPNGALGTPIKAGWDVTANRPI
jgi:type VI secretion system secreted protein Hcp